MPGDGDPKLGKDDDNKQTGDFTEGDFPGFEYVAQEDLGGVQEYVVDASDEQTVVGLGVKDVSTQTGRVLDKVEEVSSAEIILDGFTGFEVNGKTLEEWIAIAEEFYEKEAIPHDEALASLGSILQGAYPKMLGKDLQWAEVSKGLPSEVFYSSTPQGFETERAVAMQKSAEEVRRKWQLWDRDPNSPYHFLDGKRGFSERTALESARLIACEHLGSFNLDGESIDELWELVAKIQQYQLLFLAAASEKIKDVEGAKSAEESTNLGLNREPASLYRMANIFFQIAGVLTNKLKAHFKKHEGAQSQVRTENPLMRELPGDKDGFKIPATASKFFEEAADKTRVDEYIRSNLSLIFPDKAGGKGFVDRERGKMRLMVGEDMVFMNLMVLAKEYGLDEKYKDVFEAMIQYRRFQNVRTFHWDPESAMVFRDKTRVSLKGLIGEAYLKKQVPLDVLSFGYGDAMLEKFLLSRKTADGKSLVQHVYGAEVDFTRNFEDGTSIVIDDDDKMTRFVFGIQDRITSTPGKWAYREDPLLPDEMMSLLPGEMDVVMAIDGLHEVSLPHKYALGLYDKVKKGGYFYVCDPSHCQALDDVTKEAAYPFDKTRHPRSMMSLEAKYNLVHWLTDVEGAVNAPKQGGEDFSTGLLAQNNDALWRHRLVFIKPMDPKRAYTILVDESRLWEESVANDMDIFRMWPFSLVKEEKRQEFLEELIDRMKYRRPDRGSLVLGQDGHPEVKFKDLKRRLIEMLVSREEVDAFGGNVGYAYNVRVSNRVPYKKVMKMLQDTGGGCRPELYLENHLAGEVLVLKDLVSEITRLELPLGSNW